MPTNEEIQKKHGSKKGDVDYNGIKDMLNEARADTAEQIFKEIDEIFMLCAYSYKVKIEWDTDTYQALKKKYKVNTR